VATHGETRCITATSERAHEIARQRWTAPFWCAMAGEPSHATTRSREPVKRLSLRVYSHVEWLRAPHHYSENARMLALTLTPAVLSAVVLAAHFLRSGQLLACVLCLAVAALAGTRQPWAPRAMQVFLALGTLEWAHTLVELTGERRALGEPAGRLVVIMGSVIAVTLLGAVLLFTRRVREHFRPLAAEHPRPEATE
jgi:hypothetical protein